MKKIIFSSIIYLTAIHCYAQTNTFPENGSVGIGTSDPVEKLTVGEYGGSIALKDRTTMVSGTSSLGKLKFYDYGGEAANIALEHNYYFGSTPRAMLFSVNGTERLRINSAGNIGIGTTEPSGRLQIKGDPFFDATTALYVTNNASDYGRTNLILTGRFQDGNDDWNFGSNGRNSIVFAQNKSASGQRVGDIGSEKYSIQLEGNTRSLGFLSAENGGMPNMVLTQSGKVGIGTTTPNEKLSVNGNIRAKEIKVENTNWPDYVFQKEYQLPSLAETEKHIQEKGHLPGIPNAEEVRKNGINIGEINAKLLEKIEELTLYIIEQNKRIDQHEKREIAMQDDLKLIRREINKLKRNK